MLTDKLNYTGTVTVSLIQNNVVVSSRKYKNAGRAPLFQFIATCLNGYYDEVKKLRPTKIALWKNSNDYKDIALTNDLFSPSTETELEFFDKMKCITDLITINTPGRPGTGTTGSWSAFLHFLIPASQISNEGNTDLEFNQAALYAMGETDKTKPSAYFLYLNETNTAFEPIKIAKADITTTTIAIDWELNISNYNANQESIMTVTGGNE